MLFDLKNILQVPNESEIIKTKISCLKIFKLLLQIITKLNFLSLLLVIKKKNKNFQMVDSIQK